MVALDNTSYQIVFLISSPEQKVPVSYSTTSGMGIGVGVHKC